MTPRCAATTRSLWTWSVARLKRSARPTVCQYASRPERRSEATAKNAKRTRRRVCEIVAVIVHLRRSSRVARSPPTTTSSLPRRRDGLRCDDSDRRGADEPEPLRFGLDARGRVQASALDHEERVLSPDLVALRGKALRFVAGGRHGRGLREIEEDEQKARNDDAAHQKE